MTTIFAIGLLALAGAVIAVVATVLGLLASYVGLRELWLDRWDRRRGLAGDADEGDGTPR